MVDFTKSDGFVTDDQGRRQYVNRDDAALIEGTEIDATDHNEVRNELVYLVSQAGLTPSNDDLTQVYQAVKALVGAGSFLKLASTALQTVTGPVTFAGTTLVPSVADWTAKQAVPASDADNRYVRFIADDVNWPVQYIGIGKSNNAPWFKSGPNYTFLQPAGDYATNTALTAETNRATTAESNLQSSKANLAGGNDFTGSQTFEGPVTFAGVTLVPNVSDWGRNQPVAAAQADNRYVRFIADDVNWPVQYIGIGKSNNAPWFKSGPNYTFLQPAGDYATNTALTAETNRATTAESNLQTQINGKQASGDYVTHSEFPRNLARNGWQKLPSGLIIQWGQTSTSGTYSFPTTFPNVCLCIVAGNTTPQGAYVDNAFAYPVNSSQFYIATKASNTGTVTNFPAAWVAFGF